MINDKEEWEVQQVLASKKRCKLFYRVQWTGHDLDLEWYPASNLKYSPHNLRDYHLANPKQAGPPRSLDKWLRAWEEGRDNYDELDDNVPLSTR